MIDWYYGHNENARTMAKMFCPKRQTVAKWVKRYEKEGFLGLKDHS